MIEVYNGFGLYAIQSFRRQPAVNPPACLDNREGPYQSLIRYR